jgi:hypothetical protein
MSNFAVKKNIVPETVTVEGTAKRNIIRRGLGSGSGKSGNSGSGKFRKEGISGKSVDDGSLYEDPCALDENDPNYDSEEDTKGLIPGRAPLHRDKIAQSSLTLSQYKKRIQPIINEFLTSFAVEDVVESLQVSHCYIELC